MADRDGGAGGFRKETVDRLLRLHFRDGRTRVNGDAQLLMAEMLKVFVRETAARAARQAQAEDLEKVDIEHVEKVLPQLGKWKTCYYRNSEPQLSNLNH
ncbi:centromere protein X isoform X1 [Pelecanus crispus]|uniref:centromere protein X isoform X1 n=1 Tax=Pelecanus crispus TaxID=36300 RepID=UPI003F5D49D2